MAKPQPRLVEEIMNPIEKLFDTMPVEGRTFSWNEVAPGEVVVFVRGKELQALKEGRASIVWDAPSNGLRLKLDFNNA